MTGPVLRVAIERLTRCWSRFVTTHARGVAALSLLATAALMPGLGQLRLEASIESMLGTEDPARVAYESFRAGYQSDESILVGIASDDVFDADFLAWLTRLHEDLEQTLPHVAEIESLVTARATRSEQDELRVEELRELFEQGPDGLALARRWALANPLFRGYLLSHDARTTMVRIAASPQRADGEDLLAGFDDLLAEEDGSAGDVAPLLLAPGEIDELLEALEQVIARHRRDGVEVFVSGSPAVNRAIVATIQRDMAIFTGAALLAITTVLLAIFRRLSGVMLPLGVVLLGLVASFGFMGHAGLPITPATQLLPSFLLAIGVGYAIHVLVLFYRALDRGTARAEAVAGAVAHAGGAILFTAITTAGCLASFQVAELALLRDFGIAAPVGVALVFLYSVALLPALLVLLPLRARRTSREPHAAGPIDRLLTRTGDLGTRWPRGVSVGGVALTVGCVALAAGLRFSHVPLEWLPQDDPSRRAMERTNRDLGGSTTIEILVDTGRDGDLHEPEALRFLSAIQRAAAELRVPGVHVANSLSLADIVMETHGALHDGEPALRRIPATRAAVAQELLLFESSARDDLERFVDPRQRHARIQLLVSYADARLHQQFLTALEARIDEVRGGIDFPVEFTGVSLLTVRSFQAMMRGMARSYAIALAVIFPVLWLQLGGARWALVAMIPNLLPIAAGMALIRVAGFPLDAFTMLIGSIAIGVAVDDTIHFMHVFRSEHDRSGDARAAVRATLAGTGRALVVTSAVLSCGFGVFVLASMHNVVNFGVVTVVTVAVALLADILVSPALVTWLVGNERAVRATRALPRNVYVSDDGASGARSLGG